MLLAHELPPCTSRNHLNLYAVLHKTFFFLTTESGALYPAITAD